MNIVKYKQDTVFEYCPKTGPFNFKEDLLKPHKKMKLSALAPAEQRTVLLGRQIDNNFTLTYIAGTLLVPAIFYRKVPLL